MEEITKIQSSAKIILVTGFGGDFEGEEELLRKAHLYFGKPINIDDLIKKMREAIQREREA